MLFLNLNPIFRLRGIEKPFSFLIRSGFTNHTAHYLLSASPRSIRLDHIEKLCLLLKCVPNDILNWNPDPEGQTDENTPLNILRNNESFSFDLKKALMNLPIGELKSLSEKLDSESITKNTDSNNF